MTSFAESNLSSCADFITLDQCLIAQHLVISHIPLAAVVECTGLDVATCGVANATGFELLATNFSLLVASLATSISRYYFILFSFSFPQIYDRMNEC